MALDPSQFYKDPATGTTYTSKASYDQNVQGVALPGTADASTGQSMTPAGPAPMTVPTPAAPAPIPQPEATPNPAVSTAQPNPATVNATPYTSSAFYKPEQAVAGFDPSTVFNDKGEALDNKTYLAQGGKADFSNVQKVSTLQQAFNAAKASGQAAPQTPGDAAAAVKQFSPQTAPINTNVDQQLAADPGYQQLLKDQADYNSAANQSKSLLDTYNQMIKSSGLEGINTDLLNTKKIIDGTEDDIRNEVKAANGFATDSQVMALSSARNKTLIKNYNNLVAQQQSLTSQVNTMVGLASQDRDFALNSISQKLQIDQQLNEYRDKFVNNAKEGYQNIINAVGYKGLLDMVGNDPSSISLVEKTLGLGAGGLNSIVQAQQKQQNLATFADYNITSPYVNVNGEIQNTKTGDAYSSPEDFKARTGMSLQDAEAKRLIKPLGLTKDEEQQQFDNSLKLEDVDLKKQSLAIDKAQLGVSQFNAQTTRMSVNQPDTSIVDLGDGKKAIVTYDKQGNILNQQNIESPVNQAAITQQQAASQQKIENINSILNNKKGLYSTVGTNWLSKTPATSGTKAPFLADVQQLISQTTLDNLVKAKAQGATFGALSEGELQLLSASGSKLATWAQKDKNGNITGFKTTPEAFNQELDKINNFAKLDYILQGGDPSVVGVQKEADGSYTTLGSDGKVHELYHP